MNYEEMKNHIRDVLAHNLPIMYRYNGSKGVYEHIKVQYMVHYRNYNLYKDEYAKVALELLKSADYISDDDKKELIDALQKLLILS